MNANTDLSVKVLFSKAWFDYRSKFVVLFGILSAPLVALLLSYFLAEILPPLSYLLLVLAGVLVWVSQIAMIYALKIPGIKIVDAYGKAFLKIFSLLWTGILVAGNLASVFAIPLILGLVVFFMYQAGILQNFKPLFYGIAGLAAFLAVLYAIYFAILYQFTTYALIGLEKKGVSALLASVSCVKGKWFFVLTRILVTVVILTLPMFLLDIALINQQELFNLIQSVYGYVITPFVVAYMYNLFVGLKEIQTVDLAEKASQRNWVVGRAAFGFATVFGLLLFLSVVQKTDYFPVLKARLGEIQQQSKILGK